MITYNSGRWQINYVFGLRGSVIPRALCWALPSTVLAVFLHNVMDQTPNMSVNQFGSYTFVMGFLLVFRTQIAYGRYWEAARSMQRVRGYWFDSASFCFACCSSEPQLDTAVRKFKHTMVRLTSLLYCCSLQQVAICSDEAFDIIDLEGFDTEAIKYLVDAPDKCLVILQWIQQLILKNHASGVLWVAPPILTRVFQELSNGIVLVTDGQNISNVLFPFPYAQLMSIMLVVSSLLTPCVLAVVMQSVVWCAVLNFVSVTAFWSVNYIAAEIEMPFGEDPNDLPLQSMQRSMNLALMSLLDPACNRCPDFTPPEEDADTCTMQPCPYYLITDDVNPFLIESTHPKARKQKLLEKPQIRNSSDRVNDELRASVAAAVGTRQSTEGMTDSLNSRRSRAYTRRTLSAQPIGATGASPQGESGSQEPQPLASDTVLAFQTQPTQETPASDFKLLLVAPRGEETPASDFKLLLKQSAGEIEGQLAGLSKAVQRHFRIIASSLEFISSHTNGASAEMQQSLTKTSGMRRVAFLLEEYLERLVQELDGLALECVAPRPTPTAEQDSRHRAPFPQSSVTSRPVPSPAIPADSMQVRAESSIGNVDLKTI